MKWRLPRFSLLSFLLFAGLICVSVSHFRVVSENHELKRKNSDLENELGYINVADPDAIYIRKLETLDELTWRFRVCLPPKNTYMLHMKYSGGASGMSLKQRPDQFTLSVGIRKTVNGNGAPK